jgi:cell division protein FtsX
MKQGKYVAREGRFAHVDDDSVNIEDIQKAENTGRNVGACLLILILIALAIWG